MKEPHSGVNPIVLDVERIAYSQEVRTRLAIEDRRAVALGDQVAEHRV
jgi:hypothetical protein